MNIFAGLELPKAGAPPYLRWVMVAYVGYYIFVNVILEITDCITTKKGWYGALYEVNVSKCKLVRT